MNTLNIFPPVDSLSKPDSLNAVQTGIVELVEKVTTTPTTELLKDMVNAGVSFGLKLIEALKGEEEAGRIAKQIVIR